MDKEDIAWDAFQAELAEMPVFEGPEMPFDIALARQVEAQGQRNIAGLRRRMEDVANHSLFLFQEKNRVLNSLD